MRTLLAVVVFILCAAEIYAQQADLFRRCDLNADCVSDTLRFSEKADKAASMVVVWGERTQGSNYCDSTHYNNRDVEAVAATEIVMPTWDKSTLNFSNVDLNNDGIKDLLIHLHGGVVVGKRATTSKERDFKRLPDSANVTRDTSAVYIVFAARDLDTLTAIDVEDNTQSASKKSVRKIVDGNGIVERRPAHGARASSYALVPQGDTKKARDEVQPTLLQSDVYVPFEITINPNPVVGANLTFEVSNPANSVLTFIVVNDGGRVVYKEAQLGRTGLVTIDVGLLSSGTYHLVATDNNTHRLIRRFGISR